MDGWSGMLTGDDTGWEESAPEHCWGHRGRVRDGAHRGTVHPCRALLKRLDYLASPFLAPHLELRQPWRAGLAN